MAFYAVARGRITGIFPTWGECKSQVDQFPNARYKKFSDQRSAEAFIKEHQAPIRSSGYFKYATNDKTKDKAAAFVRRGSGIAASINQGVNSVLSGVQTTSLPPLISSTASAAPGTGSKAAKTPAFKRKLPINPTPTPNKRRATADNCVVQSNVDLSSFSLDEDGFVIVFTDGACKANGRRGATAGIGVWFADNHPLNISLPVEGDRRTNNTAEIQAVEKAVLKAKDAGIYKLNVKTDSQFVINCMTKWINNWRRKNWKTSDGKPVKNQTDLEKLSGAIEGVQIKWTHVRGHAGEHGNEQADQLAVAGSLKSLPV